MTACGFDRGVRLQSDGHDLLRFVGTLVSGEAAMIDNIVGGFFIEGNATLRGGRYRIDQRVAHLAAVTKGLTVIFTIFYTFVSDLIFFIHIDNLFFEAFLTGF